MKINKKRLNSKFTIASKTQIGYIDQYLISMGSFKL